MKSNSIAERFRTWAPIEAISTKIRAKLLLTLFGVSLLPLLVLGAVMYNSASDGILDQANRQLESVRSIKANQVESYFETIQKQIGTFSENRMVVEAMQSFPEALANSRAEAGIGDEALTDLAATLKEYYAGDFADEYRRQTGAEPPIEAQLAGLDADSLYLQHQYIAANVNPLGSKEDLDNSEGKTSYDKLHAEFHPIVRNYLREFGYYDIFLCDLHTGDIVYSVYKELDFTTSLIDGPYSETNFGRAFRMAAAADNPDDIFLVDYEPYLPSYENAASFIAAPIFDDGEKIGVAIFQMPIAKINQIMAERTGLGQTGETYAIGPDSLFRSESRFLEELNVGSTIINDRLPVTTTAATLALRGESGTGIIDDYRGKKVLSSWAPITIYNGVEGESEPIRWALLSEIDYEEVTTPITASGLARNAGLIVFVGLIIGIFFAFQFAKGITQQAESINDMLMQIGIGDFDARAEVVTNDELGDVAVALNAMCDNTLSLIQSREEREQIEQSIFELVQEMEEIAEGDLTVTADVREDITGPIAGTVNFMIGQLRELVKRVKSATSHLGESADEVRAISVALSDNSSQQAERIVETNTQIREITESIQSVAKKSQISAEVAEKAKESAANGLQAVSDTVDGMQRIRNQVQETSKRIKRLGESSQEIGEIVQLIAEIADRTSILALNASIQAAMAGDAGQGFAVVAEEVERLAERSNDATKQIATLIKAIQTETSEAITDMEESTREVVEGSQLATQAGSTLYEIDNVSTQLAELISDVSKATDGQTGAARQIAETMAEISSNTGLAAERSQTAASRVQLLTDLAAELRDSVSRFQVESVSSVSQVTEFEPVELVQVSDENQADDQVGGTPVLFGDHGFPTQGSGQPAV
ncbi:MAG: methyl-accepting chemotaxis protein [Planctomycetota bacterium]